MKRNPPAPLLAGLMANPLDPGYARAAARKAAAREHGHEVSGAHRGRRTANRRAGVTAAAWLSAGAVLVGLLLGVAAKNTRESAPETEKVRQALAADISVAQQRESDLAVSASALAAELRQVQATLGAASSLQLPALEQMNALVPVTGPGLHITITDPGAASGDGAVLDRDLQVLVNGLWSSGAEAVSVGGVRLRVTSAIRQAGGAILVDNRPVAWPLVVEAIGDPQRLHGRFAGTLGFSRFTAFVQLYGIGFDVTVADVLTLSAAPAVDTHHARSSTG